VRRAGLARRSTSSSRSPRLPLHRVLRLRAVRPEGRLRQPHRPVPPRPSPRRPVPLALPQGRPGVVVVVTRGPVCLRRHVLRPPHRSRTHAARLHASRPTSIFDDHADGRPLLRLPRTDGQRVQRTFTVPGDATAFFCLERVGTGGTAHVSVCPTPPPVCDHTGSDDACLDTLVVSGLVFPSDCAECDDSGDPASNSGTGTSSVPPSRRGPPSPTSASTTATTSSQRSSGSVPPPPRPPRSSTPTAAATTFGLMGSRTTATRSSPKAPIGSREASATPPPGRPPSRSSACLPPPVRTSPVRAGRPPSPYVSKTNAPRSVGSTRPSRPATTS
jgi:hypothetical protein